MYFSERTQLLKQSWVQELVQSATDASSAATETATAPSLSSYAVVPEEATEVTVVAVDEEITKEKVLQWLGDYEAPYNGLYAQVRKWCFVVLL